MRGGDLPADAFPGAKASARRGALGARHEEQGDAGERSEKRERGEGDEREVAGGLVRDEGVFVEKAEEIGLELTAGGG